MREALNKCRIEGILSECNLEYGSYTNASGQNVDTVRGNIKVLVRQTINGRPIDNEIQVEMFSPKYTKNGSSNPAYESISKIKNEFTSIAAAGGEDGADGIRITGARLQMNEYWDANMRLVSYPRISASFAQKVRKDELRPEATFTVEMVVGSQGYMENAEGAPIVDEDGNQKYELVGLIPMYGDRIDKVKFVCANENVINAVQTNWQNGDTVKASGRLNFTSTYEKVIDEQGFGESIERSRTITVRDIVITGGLPTPLEGEFAYTPDEINKALADRQARLEKDKANAGSKTKAHQAPQRSSFNLGF